MIGCTIVREESEELLVATFSLAGRVFGLDTALIQEVVMMGEVTPVHDAPSYVAGIRNLRGRIITVIDLRTRLGLASMQMLPSSRILIADWKGEPVGLLVDSMSETVAIRREELQPPPVPMDGLQAPTFLGVFHSGDRLPVLLDPLVLLDPESCVLSSPLSSGAE